MNGKIVLILMVLCVCAIARAFPATKENEISKEICLLPMAKGICRAHMMRWMYNPKTKTCDEFAYGGCAGNDNNFMTKKDCMAFCRGV